MTVKPWVPGQYGGQSEDAAYGAPVTRTEWSEAHDLHTRMNADERAVWMAIGRKLMGKGRTEYGPLDMVSDTRNMPRECMDEVVDALVYAAIASLRQSREGEPLGWMNQEVK